MASLMESFVSDGGLSMAGTLPSSVGSMKGLTLNWMFPIYKDGSNYYTFDFRRQRVDLKLSTMDNGQLRQISNLGEHSGLYKIVIGK